MPAVFGVELGKPENFRVGQRTSQLTFHAVEIVDFGRREGKSFLFVVGFQVFYGLDFGRFMMDGEDVLIQSVVHTLQHRVVVGLCRFHGEEFLNTADAGEVHVLRDFHGIGAPRGNHLATWPDKPAAEHRSIAQFGTAVEPTEFLNFIVRKLVVNAGGNDAFRRGTEKENHGGNGFDE